MQIAPHSVLVVVLLLCREAQNLQSLASEESVFDQCPGEVSWKPTEQEAKTFCPAFEFFLSHGAIEEWDGFPFRGVRDLRCHSCVSQSEAHLTC